MARMSLITLSFITKHVFITGHLQKRVDSIAQ